MTDSPTSTFCFETLAPLALEAAFDGGHLTSDGGVPWLAAADAEIGVCAEIAAGRPLGSSRNGGVRPVPIPATRSSASASIILPRGRPLVATTIRTMPPRCAMIRS